MKLMPEKASLQFRLISILGLTLIIGAVITLATVIAFDRLYKDANALIQTADELQDAWALQNLASRMERSQISYLLIHDQRYLRDNERYRQQFAEIIATRRNSASTDNRLVSLYDELERERLAYENLMGKIEQAGLQGDWPGAQEDARSLGIHLANLQRNSARLTQLLQPIIETELQRALLQVQTIRLVGLVVFLAFTALTIYAGSLVGRRLTRPMQRLTLAVEKIPTSEFDPQRIQALMNFDDQLGELTWAVIHVEEQHRQRMYNLRAQIKELNNQIKQLT